MPQLPTVRIQRKSKPFSRGPIRVNAEDFGDGKRYPPSEFELFEEGKKAAPKKAEK